MAKSPKSPATPNADAFFDRRPMEESFHGFDSAAFVPRAIPTGSYLVSFPATDDDAVQAGMNVFEQAGLGSERARDFAVAESFAAAAAGPEDADVLYYDEIGIAVVKGAPDQIARISAAATSNDAPMAMEPAYWRFATTYSEDYLQGYRRGLLESFAQAGLPFATPIVPGLVASAAQFNDDDVATWGLHATGVLNSSATGLGIKVGILDSGCDIAQPDIAARKPFRATFIPAGRPDSSRDDSNGHGTHVLGTACGPRDRVAFDGNARRYGIAYESTAYSAKVMNVDPTYPFFPAPGGMDDWIVAGLNALVAEGCHVINLSLSAPTGNSTSYENAAKTALAKGCLVVAAAGNDSRRPGKIEPVGVPARCPSILAVAAVDRNLGIAEFSNRESPVGGGEINFAAPGVDVYSSWRMPIRMQSIPGTSMAAPHVTGIAALLAQETGKRGLDLFLELKKRAKALGAPADFGLGLVRAV